MATILLMVGTAFEIVLSAKLFRHQNIVENLLATEEVVTNTIDLQSLYLQMERTFGIGGGPNSKLSSQLKTISS